MFALIVLVKLRYDLTSQDINLRSGVSFSGVAARKSADGETGKNV